MTLRLAMRSVMSRPIRSAVLACGFGFGIAVMADLLGVGEVILEQSRSPALLGGGDLVVSGIDGGIDHGRFVLSSVLDAPPLGPHERHHTPEFCKKVVSTTRFDFDCRHHVDHAAFLICLLPDPEAPARHRRQSLACAF